MKTKTLLLSFLISLFMIVPSFAVSIMVNGAPLQTDVPPQIISNRTFVPVSAVANATGAIVQWHKESKTVIISKDSSQLQIQIGADFALKNGQKISLDAPAQIVSGRTMVPLSFIASSLDVPLNYDASTKTVSLTVSAIGQPAPSVSKQPSAAQPITQPIESSYIGNSNTGKFHHLNCSSVSEMKPEHRVPISTREEAIGAGFIPCKRCKP